MDLNNLQLEDISKLMMGLKKTVKRKGMEAKKRKPSSGSVCCVTFRDIVGENISERSEYLKSSTAMATVTVGDGFTAVDSLVEVCICTMFVGEESVFRSPELKISFTATLENCFYKPYSFQMASDEKLSYAMRIKEIGSSLYRDKKYSEAFLKFRRSLHYVVSMGIDHEGTNVNLEDVVQLRVNLYNNLALCQMQFQNHPSVIALCSKAILLTPNVKSFYRRALSFIELSDYENAKADLKKLLALDKNNKAAIEKLKLVADLSKQSTDEYKNTMKKMFK